MLQCRCLKNKATLNREFFQAAAGMLAVLLFSFSPVFAGSYPGPNPTLHQIDSQWRVLYGSPVHQGIIVYNKMSGGTTTDVSRDTLCIMRMVSGTNTATTKNLMRYVQWQGVRGWGVSSGYRISPDGAKIAMQNGTAVSVCDTNGANFKVIRTVALNIDQLSLSWDDSADVRRIVYSIGFVIVRTVISSVDNTAGKTDTLWNHAWGKDPAAGSRATLYTSINKVGKYLSFDMPAGVNVPVIVNLVTQIARNPTNGGDGCQARMCQDTFGTFTYHEVTHLTAATIYRWTSNAEIGSVPCPNGQTGVCTDCGNNFYYWCDSDTNYMVQAGDNDQNGSPGCYSKAFIRKGKTSSARMMYLGDYMAFPALWIDPVAFDPTGANDNKKRRSQLSPRNSIIITPVGLTLRAFDDGIIDNAILVNVNGKIIGHGEGTSPGVQRFAIGSLPAGIYLLSWRQSGVVMTKLVTVAQ